MNRTCSIAMVAASLVATTAVTSCSSTPDITFGSPITTGAPISVPAGEVAFSQWPDTCTLLSDAEITAILPQATDITRKPKKIVLLGRLGTLNPDLTVSGGSSGGELPRGTCAYSFTLPNEHDLKGLAFLEVSLPAISTPANIAQYYDEQLSTHGKHLDVGSAWGPQRCDVRTESVIEAVCQSGRFYFEVSTEAERTSNDDWREKVLKPAVQTLATHLR
ncbi:hypothetical protein [Tsukamurella spumae]|uniref:DUF3558 domain-containing protein n=1 Tax=Tsukamurella spumae TaxID=44753 RepID=A0A846X4B2_9ACTN|nr:hypothetical protein [Tsukamurella spumae]NKY19983.1 hypothetical protein [Tsukamurella spumae]